MKQLKKSINFELGPIVIYEQELRDLHSLLSSNSKSCSMVVDHKEFTDINELISFYKNKRIPELQITAYTPHVKIELYKYSARVYVGDSDLINIGLSQSIKEILKRESQIIEKIGRFKFYLLTVFIYTPLATLLPKTPWSYISLIIFCPYMLWAFTVNILFHSRIYARTPDSIDSLFERNKDAIFVSSLTGITGFILGFITDKILK